MRYKTNNSTKLKRKTNPKRTTLVAKYKLKTKLTTIQTTMEAIKTKELSWYEHVMRMKKERWLKQVRNYVPWGKKGKANQQWNGRNE